MVSNEIAEAGLHTADTFYIYVKQVILKTLIHVHIEVNETTWPCKAYVYGGGCESPYLCGGNGYSSAYVFCVCGVGVGRNAKTSYSALQPLKLTKSFNGFHKS